MPSRRVKALVATVVTAMAGGYLAIAMAGSDYVYFQEVDQFLERGAPTSQRVRLHGTVGEHAEARPTDLAASFDLQGRRRSVHVDYRGIVPGMFGPGRAVVVEGSLDATGVFRADVLMTKCSSKYEKHSGPGTEEGP